MEAIVALSLACNVLQVVDTGYKVAAAFKEIAQSGATEENQSLILVASTLSAATSTLQASISQPASRDDGKLLAIAQRCTEVATALQAKIAPLTQPTPRKRDRLRRSLKVLWPSKEIDKLVSTLGSYRAALDTSILVDLRSRVQLNNLQQQDGFQNLETYLQDFIRRQASLQLQEHERQHEITRSMVQKGMDKLRDLDQAKSMDERQKQIISSLRFDGMNERKHQIEPAYGTTYEWIFANSLNIDDNDSDHSSKFSDDFDMSIEPEWDDFGKWLSETADSSIYWISGKPGSGKSTLVSFIYNHKKTKVLLNEWLSTGTPILLEAYLWISGKSDQRSFRGLLATLVVEVLRQTLNLVPLLEQQFPKLPHKLSFADWSTGELSDVLLFAIQSTANKYCVFIDGLDEAEDAAREKVTELILSLSELSFVKICVSSRPHQIFEDIFRDMPKLRLHQLNQRDIDQIFRHNLRPAMKNADISFDEWQFKVLLHNFRRKAKGVFLWAHLAVDSLKQGLTERDSFKELESRLEALPSKLQDMYETMWKSSNADSDLFREQRARFLKLTLLKALWIEMSVVSHVLASPSHEALKNKVIDGDGFDELASECENMAVRIKTRCVGLLELVPHQVDPSDEDRSQTSEVMSKLETWSNTAISFIHRTARDFLTTTPLGTSILSCTSMSELDLLDLAINARFCEMAVLPFLTTPTLSLQTAVAAIKKASSSNQELVMLLQRIEDSYMQCFVRIPGSDQTRGWLESFQTHPKYEREFYAGYDRDFVGYTVKKGLMALLDHVIGTSVWQSNPLYLQYCYCCWIPYTFPLAKPSYHVGAAILTLSGLQHKENGIGGASEGIFYFQAEFDGIAYRTSALSHFCGWLLTITNDGPSPAVTMITDFWLRALGSKIALSSKVALMVSPHWRTWRFPGQELFTTLEEPRSEKYGMIIECNIIWLLIFFRSHHEPKNTFLADPLWLDLLYDFYVPPLVQAILTTSRHEGWVTSYGKISEDDSTIMLHNFFDVGADIRWPDHSAWDGTAAMSKPVVAPSESMLSMVHDRSPKVDGLAELRKRGWIKYPNDPGVTTSPPPMFLDVLKER